MALPARTLKAPKGGHAMTSVAATAGSDITIEALEARILLQRLRRRIEHGSPLYLRALFTGRRLADVMDSVVDGLRTMAQAGRYDDMADGEFEDLTDVIQALYNATRFAVEQNRRFGLHRNPLHRAYFRRIVRRTDDLGSIVESFRLGMNEDFRAFAVEAVGDLKR
jgi:hypothetical protein